jgi:bla regulator protein BlaR1
MPWLSWIVSNVVLAGVLAVIAWFVQRWLRRPAVAHLLWVLVLVKLLTPPLVRVPLPASPGSLACTLGTCGCEQHAWTPTIVRDAVLWFLLSVWSLGAGATAWRAWRRSTWFHRLLTHASPAPPQWQALAARLGSELALRSLPEVLTVPGRLPPLIVPGRPRPRLLLPRDLLDRLDPAQQSALLLHELIHLKRGDHLVRMLEIAVSVAFWWFPVVGLIGRQLRGCEEWCCDAAVVAHLPQARRDYARLLLDVLDFAQALPEPTVQQATAMSASALEQRLRAILDGSPGTQRIWPVGALVLVLACAVLPCQLDSGLVRQPATNSARPEPVEEKTDLPGEEGRKAPLRSECCPS